MEKGSNDPAVEAKKAADSGLAVKSFEESQAAYTRRAELYDQQSVDQGLIVTREAALVCLKYIDNSKTSSVLDVAGGTGIVPFHLRKTGNYKGIIDILDANMEMLCVASKRELALRLIICHMVEENIPLPEDSYDAVTCVGSLYPNHLPPQSIKGMLKLVKRGGYLIFNLRNRGHAGVETYLAQLEDVTNELINNKEAELAEMKEVIHLKNIDNLTTKLYVYRKV